MANEAHAQNVVNFEELHLSEQEQETGSTFDIPLPLGKARPQDLKQEAHNSEQKSTEETYEITETHQKLFDSLLVSSKDYLLKEQILNALKYQGILENDPRIKPMLEQLNKFSNTDKIHLADFTNIITPIFSLFKKTLTGHLIIPDFHAFSEILQDICVMVGRNRQGQLSNRIPQLAKINPNKFATSVYTIDGQYFSHGVHEEAFTAQAISYPINYAIALELNGEETVHDHVGREPGGQDKGEITLNHKNLPHNPLIDAGALVCSSMILPEQSQSDRFEYITDVWASLCGDFRPGFNNSIYHAERAHSSRNHACAYFMQEEKVFPPKTVLDKTLDFHAQTSSLEVSTKILSIAAATLANGGINPTTRKKIFCDDTVRNVLSLMSSSGMYGFSGEYAFTVGLPARSSSAGALIIVVPNVLGMAIWSPRLDEYGNSLRGIEFSKALVSRFNFHHYDSLIENADRVDPRRTKSEFSTDLTFSLISAANQGDVQQIKRLASANVNLNRADYDGRTAMHLAVSGGHIAAVKYLIAKNVNLNPKDRWGNTPLVDAERNENAVLVEYIKSKGATR